MITLKNDAGNLRR